MNKCPIKLGRDLIGISIVAEVNTIFCCDGCRVDFEEDDLSLVESVIDGIEDYFLLCYNCFRRCDVNK